VLATADAGGRIVLRDGTSCAKRHEWQLPGEVNRLAFFPDGRHLATANGNGTVYVLRLPLPNMSEK
jgi:hypothetical protein